jgi:anti-anti-sigma factor
MAIQAQMWKGSKFSIDRKKGERPGEVIFRLAGPFTARDMYGSLTPVALREMFESVARDGGTAVHVLDLTGVPYMDSSGLGMIASQYARCYEAGIQMIAVGVTPRVMEQFRMTRLDTLIRMSAAVEDEKVH